MICWSLYLRHREILPCSWGENVQENPNQGQCWTINIEHWTCHPSSWVFQQCNFRASASCCICLCPPIWNAAIQICMSPDIVLPALEATHSNIINKLLWICVWLICKQICLMFLSTNYLESNFISEYNFSAFSYISRPGFGIWKQLQGWSCSMASRAVFHHRWNSLEASMEEEEEEEEEWWQLPTGTPACTLWRQPAA